MMLGKIFVIDISDVLEVKMLKRMKINGNKMRRSVKRKCCFFMSKSMRGCDECMIR